MQRCCGRPGGGSAEQLLAELLHDVQGWGGCAALWVLVGQQRGLVPLCHAVQFRHCSLHACKLPIISINEGFGEVVDTTYMQLALVLVLSADEEKLVLFFCLQEQC